MPLCQCGGYAIYFDFHVQALDSFTFAIPRYVLYLRGYVDFVGVESGWHVPCDGPSFHDVWCTLALLSGTRYECNGRFGVSMARSVLMQLCFGRVV